ncbi:glycoside hydrolase family 97 catalytic domain-containing protein [Bacteroidota bacterium]
MKKLILFCCILISITTFAQNDLTVASPNGNLKVTTKIEKGQVLYAVTFKGKDILINSPLGLITNEGDFSKDMTFVELIKGEVNKEYVQDKIKTSHIKYKANTLKCIFLNAQDKKISVLFQVSNNDIALRYEIPAWDKTLACVVEKEVTGYRFPESTTSFLSNMMGPMGGFARISPSYESGYEADTPIEKNTFPEGYVFPSLFKIGDDGWVLLSETGVRSLFCASHLSKYEDGVFTVEYPNPKQNNGFGSNGAQLGLPGVTPWRTITIGETLEPIVETTISWDVVDPLYEPSQAYKYGRSTWSWIVWQDASMNFTDQVKYIDLAAAMNYEYILIDAWWDKNLGYEKMKELVKYAELKGIGVFLWYNSNGSFNDAFPTPLNKMNTSIARKKEMKWLEEVGVKGLKVDFLGGDKQETMRLYEDILSDANNYGLMVIFHGATLPRGWERMYPNFVGSEAVLASEMCVFVQQVREQEAFFVTLHPFSRNATASMEFGGVFFNKYLNKSNKDGQQRLTTDAFQLATGVLYQNPVQMFALTPNNLTDSPEFELEFMRNIPTTWDETFFIDGYPGKYAVIARRNGQQWYVAGVNAEKTAKTVKLKLPIFAGQSITMYNDNKNKETYIKKIKVSDKGEVSITIQNNGGFVLTK